MSFIGVDMSVWDKDPRSINSFCNALVPTEDKSFPKAMINVTILSNTLDKALVEDSTIPMVEHEIHQGYFMLCSNVINFLTLYVKEGVKPHFLQKNSGMKPIEVKQIGNEVYVSVLVIIADEYCNSNYFIRPFYPVENYGAKDVTEA